MTNAKQFNIQSIMNKQQKSNSSAQEISFVEKEKKISGKVVKETQYLINNRKVTTTGVWKAIDASDVEIKMLDSPVISSVHMEDGKYIIIINSDLQIDLIRYFLLHELAHILSGQVTAKNIRGNAINFEFEFEEVDLIALKTYKSRGFDIEKIKESQFFDIKKLDKRFRDELNGA